MPESETQFESKNKFAVGDKIVFIGPCQFGIGFIQPGDKGVITNLLEISLTCGQIFKFNFLERGHIETHYNLNDWNGCERYWLKIKD